MFLARILPVTNVAFHPFSVDTINSFLYTETDVKDLLHPLYIDDFEPKFKTYLTDQTQFRLETKFSNE